MTERYCHKCFMVKPASEFGVRKTPRKTLPCKKCDAITRAQYVSVHRNQINAYRRQRTKDDPDFNRHYNLRALYGIGLNEWNKMFSDQGSKCAICETKTPNGKGWCTDHDHITGKIRGVLCHFCNSLIGYAKDNPEILRSAISYLEFHNPKQSEKTVFNLV